MFGRAFRATRTPPPRARRMPSVASSSLSTTATLAAAIRAARTASANLSTNIDAGLPAFGWQLTTSNVGLARLGIDGSSLDTYTGSATPAANTTISLKKITYDELICKNGGITLDRCLIQPTQCGNRNSIIFGYDPDTGDGQLGDVTIIDCDIDGSLSGENISTWSACAFRGAGTLRRNRIWGMGTGIAYFGSANVSSSVIEYNHVSGLRGGGTPPSDSHNEAFTIRSFSGTLITVRKNKFVADSGNDSGAIFLQAYAGNVGNVSIEDNYISCPTNHSLAADTNGAIYNGPMNFTNNRWGPHGTGYKNVAISGFTPNTWTNNYEYDANNPPNYNGAVVNP